MRGILLPQTHSKGATTPWWRSLPPGTIFNFFPELKKQKKPINNVFKFSMKIFKNNLFLQNFKLKNVCPLRFAVDPFRIIL